MASKRNTKRCGASDGRVPEICLGEGRRQFADDDVQVMSTIHAHGVIGGGDDLEQRCWRKNGLQCRRIKMQMSVFCSAGRHAWNTTHRFVQNKGVVVHDWYDGSRRSLCKAKMTSAFLESCYCRKILLRVPGTRESIHVTCRLYITHNMLPVVRFVATKVKL